MEKAQTFADHLQRLFSPHPYEGSKEHETEVPCTLNTPTVSQELIKKIKKIAKTEVLSAIKGLNIKKAPGCNSWKFTQKTT